MKDDLRENQRRGLIFAFAVCLWIDKFQLSESLVSVQLPESVISDLVTESQDALNEEGRSGMESSEMLFNETGNYPRPWVPKCCNLYYGFTFENKSRCLLTDDEFLPDFEDLPIYSEIAKAMRVETRYEYFIGDPCKEGKYILDLTAYSYDKYSLYSNGTLLYLDRLYTLGEFCTETLNGTVKIFICFGAEKNEYELNYKFVLYAVGLLISIPFLVATAVVYLGIDMVRDLRGKSLASHVLCLAAGYFVLAVVQLATDKLNEDLCIASGFIIQFFFVAAFFWLNVICYDTWWCINRDFRCTYVPTNLGRERITFCYYSLYGWYGPFILTIVSLIMDLEPAIPESFLKPNFGLQSCWFYSNDAALPYFYGPVGVIILINIVFFTLSARKIYLEQKKRAKSMLTNRDTVDTIREKSVSIRIYCRTLQECVYLFLIMGINWAAEVISWFVGGSEEIWVITDLLNAFQGVMIFYLFVIKPDVIRNYLKNKFRKTWNKIKMCDCRKQREANPGVSRNWHANINNEMAESCFDKEHEKFVSSERPTDV